MPFIEIIVMLLGLYKWVVIIGVVISWLLAFGVINNAHPLVQGVYDFCNRLTEPVMKHIRGMVKPINGIDLSPLLLLLAIHLVQRSLVYYVMPALAQQGF